MNKTLLFSIFIFTALGASAQRLIAKDAFIRFYSSTPMEDIEATTNTAVSVLDRTSGEVAFQVSIKNFTFDRALMQEHFNENYLESEKYPKASFQGKLVNPSAVKWGKDGVYSAHLKGKMNIHGVEREITTPVTFTLKSGQILLESTFYVQCVDYNIEVPTLVVAKIAEKIQVSVKTKYVPASK